MAVDENNSTSSMNERERELAEAVASGRMTVDEAIASTNQDTQTQQSTPAATVDDVLEIRKPSAEEALDQARNSGTGKSIVSSLENARSIGNSKLVDLYERQLNSLAESITKQNVVAVDKSTGKIIDIVTEAWANRPVIGGAEAYLKNRYGTKLLIENEADRILSGSNTISNVTIDRVERTPEGFVAVTNTGARFSPRATEAQAIEEASEWFGVGEKVAETAEQKAALTKLAVQVRQFGGRTLGGRIVGNLLRQAMPDVADSEVRRLASSIQPAVKVNSVTGQAYTTYGAGLTLQVAGRNKLLTIVSPEGVRLNNFDFSMEQMLAYGITAEAALEGIQRYEEARGSIDSPFNRASLLQATLTAGVDGTTFKNALMQQNRLGLQSRAAINAAMAGRIFEPTDEGNLAFNRAMREASQNPATIASQNFNYADFFANPTDVAELPEGFATKQFGDFYAEVTDPGQYVRSASFYNEDGTDYSTPGLLRKMQLEASAYEILTLAMPTADTTKVTEFTLPSWSLDSYTQELNNIYQTPNNNIQLGSNGLEYRFEDGTTRVWGRNVDDLNALPAMFNIAPAGGRQGELFWNARQFNSADEYAAWKKTYDARFDMPGADVARTTTATTTSRIEEPTTEQQTETEQTFEQTYPEYTAPEGFGDTEQETAAGQAVPGYGNVTEETVQAGQQMYGTLPFQYTPTSTYTIGTGGTTGQAQAGQPSQYSVRQFKNASGLTTSITFADGKPLSRIPSGFYPADSQPATTSVAMPTVEMPTVTPSPQVQDVQQAVTQPSTPAPAPSTSQVTSFQEQQQQTQQAMNPVNMYTPNFTQQPTTYQMAQGGSVPMQTTATNTQPVGEFAGFRPEALQRIANTVGYQGDMNGFNAYLQSNPAANEQMTYFMNAARKMAKGGLLKAADGVDTTGAVESGNATKVMPTVLNQQYIPQQVFPEGANLPQVQAQIAKTPGLPTGATVVPTGTTLEAGQLISPASGQVSGAVALPTAQAATTAAAMPQATPAAQASVIESSQSINNALQTLQAAQSTLDPRAEVLAAQQTASSVGDVQAAQGNAILMDNPVQRQIQDGELVSGVANAQTAAAFTEQVEAAQATPSQQATVQGQLEGLMAQFEGGETPAWAAGSMRAAMATLSARGLGASSMAGQAVIQAAMEAALPIAQIDAQTQAQFEAQNLSNRQQRAMLAAQQRASFLGQEFDQAFQARVANAAKVSDIANMNFTAEQQVALENSRIANTMNLQNLNNQQAMVMAEAAALANLDMQNLNNRQQAAVQNAQNFLSVDMTNLSNQQQTDMFKAQQRIQSLFTDQAAQNAAQQFNASSQNQVDQFFASLATQTAQFNATQANAQSQFNAGQVNTIERFNAEINNQRDQFNAQNRLIIDQSNAQWRREIATADTSAVNRANELNATALLGVSQSAYNNLWQYYRDNMEWAWTSAENERQRVTNMAIAQLQADTSKDIQSMKEDYESSSNFGSAVFKFLTTDISNSLLGGLFG